jgi:putative ABC transport system permease protein
MQLGFYNAVSRTATLIYNNLNFDLVLTSPNYVMISQAGTIPRRQLYQTLSHPDVLRAMPLQVGRTMWRNPDPKKRHFRAMILLGVNPTDPISNNQELTDELRLLALPDAVLMDRNSRKEVGPQDVGLENEVGPIHLKTVGQFTIGPGFEAGLIIVSDETFPKLYGGRPAHEVSLGLIKLRDGVDPKRVAAELKERLPPDVRVMTREEVAECDTNYWVNNTSTGIIFTSGVIVALLFGIVIIYQVLSMEVTHRLSEYATLKAMGYSDLFLAGVVMQQALIYAIVSYVPGFVFGLLIYALGGGITKLPVGMTWQRALGVFLANVVMCVVSGLLALRILRRADPVDLF